MNPSPNVIIISGPTACMKTSTSIELALHLQRRFKKKAIIINFDSVLFYKNINIASAKPTIQEQQGIEHAMIDIAEIDQQMDASQFVQLASALIEKNIQNKVISILVGGSAFYLRALIKGMYSQVEITTEIIEKTQRDLQKYGLEKVRNFLQKNDFESYQRIHQNDQYRIMRAYQYFLQTGRPISEERERFEKNGPYDFSRCQFSHWKTLTFYLNIPKEQHYPLIIKRTQQMLKDGAIQEIKTLLRQGASGQEHALGSVGPKEIVEFLTSKSDDMKGLEEKIFISTRQLAKSQRTFFKKIAPKIEINPLKDLKILYEHIDTHFSQTEE